MYMDFEKAVSFLGRFAPLLRRVPQRIREEVFDVRLSVHRPVMLCCRARILFLKMTVPFRRTPRRTARR